MPLRDLEEPVVEIEPGLPPEARVHRRRRVLGGEEGVLAQAPHHAALRVLDLHLGQGAEEAAARVVEVLRGRRRGGRRGRRGCAPASRAWRPWLAVGRGGTAVTGRPVAPRARGYPSCFATNSMMRATARAAARGIRLAVDEALRLALVELEIHLAARLAIAGDEALEVGPRVRDVAGALQIERRRQSPPSRRAPARGRDCPRPWPPRWASTDRAAAARGPPPRGRAPARLELLGIVIAARGDR